VFVASALRVAGIEMPELDARLLLCHAVGLTHEATIARASDALSPTARARLDAALARRLKREPIARITGERQFYGRRFIVDPHVLDPRPDTETLIEAALGFVERNGLRSAALNLLDLGTGTGCILLTLLAELPHARGLGTDISEDALRVAAANAERLGLSARAAFASADWLDGADGEFDLILSNPPYIPARMIGELADDVALYDPRLALDGGADGLDAYRRIAARAREALAPGGRLILEVGEGQADPVTEILQRAGLIPDQNEPIRSDLAGIPRVVLAGL
jgi:release factor glutamine methyltransferase